MELGGHGFWRRRPFTPLYPHPLSRPSPSSQSRLSHNAKSAEGKFDCAEESILLTHKFSHARWSGQTHKRERGGTGNSIWNSIWGTKDDRFRWVRAHLAFRPSDLPFSSQECIPPHLHLSASSTAAASREVHRCARALLRDGRYLKKIQRVDILFKHAQNAEVAHHIATETPCGGESIFVPK